MYCPFCEYEVPDEAKYCHNCGNKLPESNETDSEHVAELSKEDIEIIPEGERIKQKSIVARKIGKIIGKIIKFIGIFIVCLLIILIGLLVAITCFALSWDADERKASDIANAIEPTNSDVRAYALRAIYTSHAGEYNIQQICDIHNKLTRAWVYVNDPSNAEYYSPASESVKLLRGDCDDYAILMASLISSIGGNTRIVCAKNAESVGHAYAEVCLSDFKGEIQSVLEAVERQRGDAVHYHIDDEGNYWLNLDWTDTVPGGEFFESVGNELVIWPDGTYNRITLIPGNSDDDNRGYGQTNSKYTPTFSKAIEPMGALVLS